VSVFVPGAFSTALHTSLTVIAPSLASRQPVAGMVQSLVTVSPKYVVNITRNPVDDMQTEVVGILQQVRAQSPAYQGGNSLFLQHAQSLEGAHIGQQELLPQSSRGEIRGEDEHPGTPIEHWCDSRTKYRYCQFGNVLTHNNSSYAALMPGNFRVNLDPSFCVLSTWMSPL